MNTVNFKEMQKKSERLIVLVSPYDKQKIKDFCKSKGINTSDLVRESLKKVMNEKQS